MAGIAAVAGFGTVAAITFPGHAGASAATADTAGAVSAATGTSASQPATAGSFFGSLFSSPTPSQSRSSGAAHVVTGGS